MTQQITCGNCAAKLKLPDTFQKPQAKCPKCGSVIDVLAQRSQSSGGASAGAATTPASAKPARAKAATVKPSGGRPTAPKAPTEKPSRARAGAGARKKRGGDDGDDAKPARGRRGSGGNRGRRGADKDEGSGSQTGLFIGIGVVVVAIAVVGYVMFGTSDSEPEGQDTANNDKTNTESADTGKATDATADKDDAGTTEASADAGDSGSADGTADKGDAAATDAGAAKDAADAAASKDDADASESTAPKKADEIKSAADVYNPSADLDPLQWPDDITAEQKTDALEQIQAIKDGGLPGIRAKRAFEEDPYVAMFAITDRLRTVNYTNSEEAFFAYELHKLLEAVTAGINVGYRPVQFGEAVSLEDAHWNARTARALFKYVGGINSRDKFESALEARKKKQK